MCRLANELYTFKKNSKRKKPVVICLNETFNFDAYTSFSMSVRGNPYRWTARQIEVINDLYSNYFVQPCILSKKLTESIWYKEHAIIYTFKITHF